jgi:hypothetical protein
MTEERPAAALYVLIGAAPRTEWLKRVLARDDHGFQSRYWRDLHMRGRGGTDPGITLFSELTRKRAARSSRITIARYQDSRPEVCVPKRVGELRSFHGAVGQSFEMDRRYVRDLTYDFRGN